MKNIIVGLFTLLTIGLMVFTFNQGRAFNGGEQAKVIKDFGDSVTLTYTKDTPKEKDDRAKEAEALNSLKEKAGNIGSFKVSKEYKQNVLLVMGQMVQEYKMVEHLWVLDYLGRLAMRYTKS